MNFQLVYGVSSDLFNFQYMFGSPVLEWPVATKFHSAISLQCLYIFSPSRYLQHGQQEKVAGGSGMVRHIENH